MNNAVLTAGDRLRVHFIRTGDRWAHCIRSDGAVWAFHAKFLEASLLSWEGTAEEDWPPSPPFQSLELHTVPGGPQLAMLVGMAGGNHWSASIEADEAGERVFFDIACRIANEPQWLGSSYALPPFASSSPQPSPIKEEGEIVRPCIELDQSFAPADGVRPELEATDRQIIVRVKTDPGPLPRTVRWRYLVKLKNGSR
jgi:hypothetical protein